MKNYMLALMSIFHFTSTLAQNEDHQIKFDSIVEEATIIYNFEKTIWQSSDLIENKSKIKNNIGGYIVYQEGNIISNIFYDKTLKNALASITYDIKRITKPSSNYDVRNLTPQEKDLVEIKNNFIQYLNANIGDFEYQQYEKFNPNIVMIPKGNSTYFYLIMGTSEQNVIPFGNDYFFEWDNKSRIIRWQKFHKSLISTNTKLPGSDMQVISVVHSHLPITPYITSTDICTFRLYGIDLFGMQEFQVLSTALDLMFTYNSKTNKISISDF